MAHLDPKDSFDHFKERVTTAVQEHFPIKGQVQSLHLSKIEVPDVLNPNDIRAQHKAKVEGGTWAAPVYAHVQLTDNTTGKVVSSGRMKIAEIPKTTQRFSYILDGQEYQVDNQWQLRPGVYARRRQNGELESRFNVAGKSPFDVTFSDDTKKFVLEYGKSKLPLYPIMKTMGVSDAQLESTWGKEVLEANKAAHGAAGTVARLHKLTSFKDAGSQEEMEAHVRKVFEDSKLRPDSTKLTLGKSFEHVDGEVLHLATQKLLKVQAGHPEDDRDSLLFKDLRSVGDFAYDKIAGASKTIKQKAMRNINTAKDFREVLKPDMFSTPLSQAFLKNSCARVASQINPVEMVSSAQQTTIMGAGGIQSDRSITQDAKMIDDSHIGFLDPINTPEGCHDSLTEVFTSGGWLPWPQVTRETELACLVDGHMEFHRPLALVVAPYTGSMHRLRTDGIRANKPIDYFVTPNHRIWARPVDDGLQYRFARADEMHGKPRVFQVGHGALRGDEQTMYELPYVAGNNSSKNVREVDLVDWAALVGWVLSEGHVRLDTETSDYKVHICQSDLPGPNECARIEALLNRLPFTWSVTQRENNRNIYTLSTKQLAFYFAQFGLSYEKYIPEEAFTWSIAARTALLDALMRGDGRQGQRRASGKEWASGTYTTTSRALALGVERLMISLGFAARVRSYEDPREERYHDVYEVRQYLRPERHVQRPQAKRAYSIEQYAGMVYCAEVPGGLMYIRRSDSVGHWSGNSRTGVTLRLPIGVKKVGHEAKVELYNLKTGKSELLSPLQVNQANVAFSDQFDWKNGKPVARGKVIKAATEGNQVREIPVHEATHTFYHPSQLFNLTSNLVPFMNSTSAGRIGMATRHIEQAISLRDREAPLVQSGTGIDRAGLNTFEHVMGEYAAHQAPVAGKVIAVKADGIHIQDAAGKKHEVQLYNNFPLNDAKSSLTSSPLVKVGDTVRERQVIADTNYSKNGQLALGTNLRVGYMSWKGINYEDGIVISKSAAEKLTSEHMSKPALQLQDTHVLDKKRFQVHLPLTYTQEQLGKLDDKGVVRVGQKVRAGDPLIAAMKPFELKDRVGLGAFQKSKVGTHTDSSLRWDSGFEGTVTAVHHTADGIQVHVKTQEEMKVGDKMSSRNANKGVVAAILPDHEMPKDKSGKPLQVMLNYTGVGGRINLSQMYEVAASKVARKTGKPYIVENFTPGVDNLKKLQGELKAHGLSDTEEVFDPHSGHSLGHILTGEQHMFKLVHQIDKKESARSGMTLPGEVGGESYDINLQPTSGSHSGGQSMGALGTYALLAHGASANLREIMTLKAEGEDPQTDPAKRWKHNDPSSHRATWTAIQQGTPIPNPKPTFAYEKFVGMLKGAGINVEKKGHEIITSPLTDKQILALSNGREISKPAEMVYGKSVKGTDELKPKPGGLFDEKLTGGHGGTLWSHIKLAEPTPNPLFLAPIRALTGLSGKEYEDVLYGRKGVGPGGTLVPPNVGLTSGAAIQALLDKVDVSKELPKARKALDSAKPKDVDKQLKKVKYLAALSELKMSPSDAYILHHLPVIPPVMRPVSALPSGDVKFADINGLYNQLGQTNATLQDKTLQANWTEERKAAHRQAYHESIAAIIGVGVPYKDQKLKGLLHQISGGQPKSGFYQGTLMAPRQDLSMRSVIIPGPHLGLDEVGLPREYAKKLFEPFLVKKLTEMGAAPTSLAAQTMLAKNTDKSINIALEKVMAERPVLMKRDPALHAYSVQGFHPRIASSKAIEMHPMVCGGFNADFDGDSILGEVLVLAETAGGAIVEGGGFTLPHTGNVAAIHVLNLEDFPRLNETAVLLPGGATEYSVPSGTYVPAFHQGRVQMMPVTRYSVHPACEEWVVRTERGRELHCSEDHSLALLDPDTLEVVKRRPADAQGLCLPTLRGLTDDAVYTQVPGVVPANAHALAMQDPVTLDFSTGWFVGASTGDGWVTKTYNKNTRHKEESTAQARTVNLAFGKGGEEVAAFWLDEIKRLAPGANPVSHMLEEHVFEGHAAQSGRVNASVTSLGLWLEGMMGTGAHNKHLPPHFLCYPDAFRRGLFCGLIDTDGTVNWVKAAAKNKPQFQCSFTTVSAPLADGMQLLALSLGIVSTRTVYTRRDKPVFSLSFSARSIQDAVWMELCHEGKAKNLERLRGQGKIEFGRADIVPLPPRAKQELVAVLLTLGAGKRRRIDNHHLDAARASYVVLQSRKTDTFTRTSLTPLLTLLEKADVSAYLQRWLNVVSNPNVGWDLVTEASVSGEVKTMYDLTVPEAWTFCTADGAVVWDTASIYVPLSKEAVDEAHKMVPSKNLFAKATGKLAYTPTLEYAMGMYKLSDVGKKTDHKYAHPADILAAFQDGKIKHNDVVSLGGKDTTPGRILLATGVPDSMQDKMMHNLESRLDKKGTEALLSDIGKKHPELFGAYANRLKDLGSGASTGYIEAPITSPLKAAGAGPIMKFHLPAHTLTLADLEVDHATRDPILAQAKKEVDAIHLLPGLTQGEKDRRAIAIYAKADDEMYKMHTAKASKDPNHLMQLNMAGIKPGRAQYQQIVLAPMLMKNSKNETIPSPITKSYSEGLDLGSYWTGMHGARRGAVMKVQEVQEPGYLSKLLVNTTMNQVVTAHDCGTHAGITMSASDSAVHDRHLAKPFSAGSMQFAAGTVLTPEVVGKIRAADKDAQLIVRSPLKCSHDKGVCQKCMGLQAGGLVQMGANVGIQASQSIGERAVQLTLKEFHTGGSATGSSKATNAFVRFQQLTQLPQTIKNSATLAMHGGAIEKVTNDATGTKVIIAGKVHHVGRDSAGNSLATHLPGETNSAWAPPTVGTVVKPGQFLSDPGRTVLNPHDLYKATGSMATVQNELVREMHDIYKSEGVDRRHIELLVRAMGGVSKVQDSGGHPTYLRGEFHPTTQLDAVNRELVAKGQKPIDHSPVLKGVAELPLIMHDDWMAKLQHKHLRATLADAAATRASSDIHGVNPLAGLAYGAEFGRTSKDSLNPSFSHLKNVPGHLH
jgi:DNA-directed RNA polymerase beta subunit